MPYSGKKLGRRPASRKPAIKFADHLTAAPTHPLVQGAPALNYPMDANDYWGDCVVAGWDHFQQVVQTLLKGSYTNLSQAEILALYRTQNPDFDPNSVSNGPGSSADGGMDIQTFLGYLASHGKILGFAKVDAANMSEMQAAIYLGLGIITGETLTVSQQSQNVWDYVPGDAVWGGHCTVSVGYGGVGETVVTWGRLTDITNAFVLNQIDEAWFVITQAHVDHPDFRANYNLESFAAAYKQITGRDFPVVVPAPPAPPGPSPMPPPIPPTPLPPSPTPSPRPVPGTFWQAVKNFLLGLLHWLGL